MKKIFLIFTILFVSVLSTACINNLAVQELNTKAKEYLDAGELDKAICRYKSSLDLDNTIFETNYNLGVALVSAKEYSEAIDVLKKAISINPSFADTYYSLAVALENEAYEKVNGEQNTKVQEEPTEENIKSEVFKNKELTKEEKEEVSKYFLEAIDNYNKYLSLNASAEDKSDVAAHIETLNGELLKYSVTEPSIKTED